MRGAFRARLRLVLFGIGCTALLISVRLYFVQIVHGDEYAAKADRQYISRGEALFDRGAIYFTRKDGTLVSAATLASGFLVAVNPRLLTDPEAAYAALTAIASSSSDRASFMKAATNTQAVYIEVAHHINTEAGRTLAAQKIPGLIVLRERWRTYPGGELGAQTLGTVGFSSDDNELKGRTGLEAKYENILSRSGDALYQNFFAELFADVGNLLKDARAEREGEVITTLEPEVETRLMNNLRTVMREYASTETGGIIMDPRTGAIIAIGSYPTYNANDFSNEPIAVLTNPLVSHVYEFGSIMKPLTVAAALDAGVVTPSSTYKDTGCLTLDTATICNFDHKARGVVALREILSQSLNVGAAYLADSLGGERLRAYFMKLGFGAKTGIDVPAETSGLIKNLSSPRKIEFATAAFGQGIAITPIEMIRALGTLANNGVPVTPHLARAIKLDTGITKTIDWANGQAAPVFNETAVRETTEMLTYVVDHSLSHGTLAIPTLSVAAKTGTAQLTNGTGGYYQDRYFHSFFGYFPSYDPRFIILLYTYDPKGVQYASETLTTTFMDLVHFLADYYALPPDRVALPSV
jgi:cell division protein FtsI/penicillin-binding protein 2